MFNHLNIRTVFFIGLTFISSMASATDFLNKNIVGTRPGVQYEKAIDDVVKFLGADRGSVKLNKEKKGSVSLIMGREYPEGATIEYKNTKVNLSFTPIKPFKSKKDIVVMVIHVRNVSGPLDPYDSLVKKFGQPTNVDRTQSKYSYTYYWCTLPQKNADYGCMDGPYITAASDYLFYQNGSLSRDAIYELGKQTRL